MGGEWNEVFSHPVALSLGCGLSEHVVVFIEEGDGERSFKKPSALSLALDDERCGNECVFSGGGEGDGVGGAC